MSAAGPHVELIQEERYRFRVEVDGPGGVRFQVAEGPPLGPEGDGPSPSALLAAAVGGCMSASLLFCLDKAKIPVEDLRASVHATVARNEEGRLRITEIEVDLEVDALQEDPSKYARCLEIFESYCTVTQSVRQGIPVKARVRSGISAAGTGEGETGVNESSAEA